MTAAAWSHPGGPTRNSVAYLTTVSLLASVVGAVQAVVVARILGPGAFGLVAIIAGLHGAVLNFLDVRLSDLAMKLYYDPQPETSTLQYRASVLHICIVGNGVLAILVAVAGTGVALAGVRFLTDSEVRTLWVIEQGVALATVHWAGTFTFLQRLSGRFFVLGTGRLVGQLLGTAALVALILRARTLDAYFHGLLLSALLSAAVAIGTSWLIWNRMEGVPLRLSTPLHAWTAYRRHTGFLFFGNLLGYAKMFHRSTDTLLVAALSSDATVGLYKLARQFADALYLLYDVLNQVLQPRFLSLLADRRIAEYRSIATRVAAAIGALGLALLTLEITLGPWAIVTFLGSRFSGVYLPIVALTVAFVLAAGFQLWTWPAFVGTDRLRTFAMLSYAAVAAQYAIASALLWTYPTSALGPALGYLAHYVVLAMLSLAAIHRLVPGIVPLGPRHHAKASARLPEAQ